MDNDRQRKANEPYYWPLWIRLAVTAAIALWFILDLLYGNSLWAAIAFAMFCYAVWTFFLNRPKTPDKS